MGDMADMVNDDTPWDGVGPERKVNEEQHVGKKKNPYTDMKLCLFCEHFHFDGGSPHYSDLTPGVDMTIKCQKGHWEIDSCSYADDYRKCMLKAEDCKDFKRVIL